MAEAMGKILASSPIRISPPNMPNIDDKNAVAKVASRIMAVTMTLMGLA
jgi:hypothetical protein